MAKRAPCYHDLGAVILVTYLYPKSNYADIDDALDESHEKEKIFLEPSNADKVRSTAIMDRLKNV